MHAKSGAPVAQQPQRLQYLWCQRPRPRPLADPIVRAMPEFCPVSLPGTASTLGSARVSAAHDSGAVHSANFTTGYSLGRDRDDIVYAKVGPVCKPR